MDAAKTPEPVRSPDIKNPGINLIKHVALFEERHIVPEWVHDFIFEKRDQGWDTLDIWEFQRVALQKLLRWKYEGIGTIYIYLSGLTTAAISAINAAYKSGIYVRLFHYSYVTDTWLPQNLDFLTPPIGVPGALTTTEVKNWEYDRELKEQLTDKEYSDFRFYVKCYLDFRDKNRENIVDWATARRQLSLMTKYPRMDYIDLMRPFLAPLDYQEQMDMKGENYNETLRNHIIRTRRRTDPTPISSSSDKRKSASRTNTQSIGYCTRPALKKYKKRSKH